MKGSQGDAERRSVPEECRGMWNNIAVSVAQRNAEPPPLFYLPCYHLSLTHTYMHVLSMTKHSGAHLYELPPQP